MPNIPAAQFDLLNTPYRGNDAQDYLNYLRGDTSQEQGSLVANSSKAYRARTSLVGDIVNSKVTVVGPPSQALSEGANPGYGAFKAARKDRPNYLIVGTNAGVVHVIDGSLTGDTAGREIFAYVLNLAADGAHYWVFAHVTPSIDVNGTVVCYHSSRRTATAAAISRLQPIYQRVRAAERRQQRASEAAVVGLDLLGEILAEQGLGYDEWVWTLASAKARVAA